MDRFDGWGLSLISFGFRLLACENRCRRLLMLHTKFVTSEGKGGKMCEWRSQELNKPP